MPDLEDAGEAGRRLSHGGSSVPAVPSLRQEEAHDRSAVESADNLAIFTTQGERLARTLFLRAAPIA